MFRLLPEEEKKRLHKEYLLRFFIVFGLFLFGALVIGSISLLPSFVRSDTKDADASKQLNHLKDISAQNSDPKFSAELKSAQDQIAQLSEGKAEVPLHQFLAIVTKDRPAGLKISNISLSRAKAGNSLQVSGTAPTRESLVAFKKTLESESIFTSVDSPVSELAKSKDIGFSIVISGTF